MSPVTLCYPATILSSENYGDGILFLFSANKISILILIVVNLVLKQVDFNFPQFDKPHKWTPLPLVRFCRCEGKHRLMRVCRACEGLWRQGCVPDRYQMQRSLRSPVSLYKSASSVIAHFSMPPVRIRQVIAVAFDLIPFFIGITGCGL